MFVYSLSFLFTRTELLSLWEFGLIVMVLFEFIWVTANEVEPQAWPRLVFANWRQSLQEAWVGKQSLWLVFWPFFVCLNLVLFYLDYLIKHGEFTASSWDAAHLMLLTPVVFWTVCVWRNAVNCSHKLWSVLAKLTTIAVFFEYALKLYLRLSFAREYFNCHGLLVDYTACF